MQNISQNKIALFLDRDGIVNVDFGYVWQIQDLMIQSGFTEIMKYFCQRVDYIIVISNQSGIGRGMYTLDDFNFFNLEINKQLSLYNLKIDKFYCCPHPPNIEPRCSCRKPEIGMLLDAQQEYSISLKDSILIGDKKSDILAAISAGLDRAYLLSREDDIEDLEFENTDVRRVEFLIDILNMERARGFDADYT